MLTEATAKNLERKAAYTDHLQLIDGKPCFSWIDLNLTELCNRGFGHPRACTFCPRIDPKVYPNQKLSMSLALAVKIGDELEALQYEGAVVLCGFGEPMLHPALAELIACLGNIRVEIVTNGDFLTVAKIEYLVASGLDYFAISLYDGPHQIEKFDDMFARAGQGRERYTLRDRWYGADKDFGLKLTNRAGMVTAGNQPGIDPNRRCWYPGYQLQVDFQGDVLLCPQLWDHRLRFGNLHEQSLWEIWNSPALHKRRMSLIEHGRHGLSGCEGCNTEGTCHGGEHAEAWQRKNR